MNNEIVIDNFSGGLDNVSPINRMKMDSSPDCANFMFNRDGSIRKRLGYIQASATDQASKIVKIHDFVDRAGVESKLIVLASGAVKVLSGTTISTHSIYGVSSSISACSQVDSNTTYFGANDALVITNGGLPYKIYNNTVSFELLGDVFADYYCIEYVSETKIYIGGSDYKVYLWNGTALSQVGTNTFNAVVRDIHYASDTEIYCVTDGLWYWNGTTWAEKGSIGYDSYAIHYVSSTNIYVVAGGQLHNWNGSTWSQIGTLGTDELNDVHYIGASDIYVCSNSGSVTGLWHWTGSWSQIGTDRAILEIHYIAANNIYAAGSNGVEKWNGSNWVAVGTSGDASSFKYVGDSQIYAVVGGQPKYYNGTTWAIIVNNDFTMPNSSTSDIYFSSTEVLYMTSPLGFIKILNIGNYSNILANNFIISGDVASTNLLKITLSLGDTDNIHAGDYLNHASITSGIYVTNKDATSIYVSTALSVGAYTRIVVSQAPKAYYNEVYNDLLILGNIEYAGVRYPAQIAISETKENGGKEDFYGNSGLLNVLEFGTGEGDGITAIKSLNGRLIVWKRFSVFSLSMVDPRETETIYRQKISDKGCWCFGSIQKIPLPQGISACIYMNDEGFYLTDGTQCWQTPAMKKVYYAVLVTNASLVTSAWDEDNDLYYVAFSTTGTTNNIVLAYSPFMDAFMPIEYTHTNYTVSAFGIFNRALYHAEIYGSLAYLYQDNQNYGDAGSLPTTVGSPITYQWKTPLINLNVPKFLKEFRELCAEWKVKAADGTPSATMTVTINLYKNGSSSPDVVLTDVNTNTTEALDNIQKKFSLKDRYCQLEITGGTARDILELHLIVLKYKQIGVR